MFEAVEVFTRHTIAALVAEQFVELWTFLMEDVSVRLHIKYKLAAELTKFSEDKLKRTHIIVSCDYC